jgi:hypothetical protein
MASKIIYVIVAMVLLNVGLLLFSCSSWDTETGTCAGTLLSSDSSNSTIWSMIVNPTTVGSGFWEVFFGSGWGLLAVVGGITLATVLVGTTVFGKNIETTVYIAIGIGLASMVYPVIKLYQIINGLGAIGDTTTRTVLAIIVPSIMFVVYIFTVLDWARGRE